MRGDSFSWEGLEALSVNCSSRLSRMKPSHGSPFLSQLRPIQTYFPRLGILWRPVSDVAGGAHAADACDVASTPETEGPRTLRGPCIHHEYATPRRYPIITELPITLVRHAFLASYFPPPFHRYNISSVAHSPTRRILLSINSVYRGTSMSEAKPDVVHTEDLRPPKTNFTGTPRESTDIDTLGLETELQGIDEKKVLRKM